MVRRQRMVVLLGVVVLVAATNLLAREPQGPPDLTRPGEIAKVDRERTYNLGATGLGGYTTSP